MAKPKFIKSVKSFFYHRWYAIALVLALGVRLILALLSDDFNDDYVTPILLTIRKGFFPEVSDCWECYQPPLFIYVIKYLTLLFHSGEFITFDEVLNTIRVFNFTLSAILAISILNFIRRQQWDMKVKLALALFWSLNPELVSIGALNTNDMLLILLGWYFFLLVLSVIRENTFKKHWVMVTVVLLAIITKGNGLVLAVCYAVVVGSYWLVNNKSGRFLAGQLIILTAVVVVSGATGKYFEKYKKHGNAFIINQQKQHLPPFVGVDNYEGRKGVESIVDAFMTFKISSLIQEPYTNDLKTDYPAHRTSLLTQLYGQFSNYMFERHPEHWISSHPDMQNLARINYLIQLPMFILFVFGFAVTMKRSLHIGLLHTLPHLFILAFYAFLIKYSMDYRDFGNMKLIFMLPVLPLLIDLHQKSLNIWVKLRPISLSLLHLSSILYMINFAFLVRALLRIG